MIYISRFFFGISNQIKNFYLNSNIYDKKISKFKYKNLVYKPSPHLLSSIIKYQKKNLKLKILHLTIFGITKIFVIKIIKILTILIGFLV